MSVIHYCKAFGSVGYAKRVAVEDACRIEHVIAPQSFEAIKEFAARASGKESRKQIGQMSRKMMDV